MNRGLGLSWVALFALPASAAGSADQAGRTTDEAVDRWQQRVDYQIEARLDEFRATLQGRLRLTYTNNSPDTLRAVYLHLYLNAFRPNSLWARSELRPWLDFQSLADSDYAFERLGRVTIDGRAVIPRYPHAPDSTVAELSLPEALPPGGRLTLEADWEARTSTLVRRQGRAGRHWDLAQWYPKIAVYDRFGWQARPLHPHAEFYGEFGNYDVTLEVLADQVMAATGLPVAGVPGWEVSRSPRTRSVTHGRELYDGSAAPPRPLGLLSPRPLPGFKRVRWLAEQVHDFSWSVDPAFRYEEGRYGDVIIRVLYRPEEEETWSGNVVRRAATALAWLDTIFGPYPWPQITIARRIDGGASEFPMLIMQDGPSMNLILHEMAHQYAYGALANNEWKEAWLDEGFAVFQSRWYMQRRYGPFGRAERPTGYRALAPRLDQREEPELNVLRLDLSGWSQPVATPAEEFVDLQVMSRMALTKGSLFFDLLRYQIGEERFRLLLRAYYGRWKFRHVDEDALRETAEEICDCDLSWFFTQWLHGTPLIDYALGGVEVARTDSGFVTTVEVVRKGDGAMPVEVAVRDDDGGEVRRRAAGRSERERVSLASPFEPATVAVDPDNLILDWNRTNNGPRSIGGLPFALLGRGNKQVVDWPFLEQRRRDARVQAWSPLVWYNSADRLVFGVRARSNLMGWLDLTDYGVAHGLEGGFDLYYWLKVRDPLWWRAPKRSHELAFWDFEGRSGVSARIEWDRSPRTVFAPDRRTWLELRLMDADASEGHLIAGRWDDALTAELGLGYRESRDDGDRRLSWSIGAGAGGYRREGGPGEADRSGGFVRGAGELRWSVTSRSGVFGRARLFAAGVAGSDGIPSQRRVFVGGAGPFEVFWNPLLRSGGSILRRPGVRYFAPGGGGFRAFRPDLGGLWALAASARVGATLDAGALGTLELSAFANAGLIDGRRVAGPGESRALTVLEAGPGLRLSRRVADGSVSMSLDLPTYTSHPSLAADSRDADWGFRWAITFGPGF